MCVCVCVEVALKAAGCGRGPLCKGPEQSQMLSYLSMHSACTLTALPNLVVQKGMCHYAWASTGLAVAQRGLSSQMWMGAAFSMSHLHAARVRERRVPCMVWHLVLMQPFESLLRDATVHLQSWMPEYTGNSPWGYVPNMSLISPRHCHVLMYFGRALYQ